MARASDTEILSNRGTRTFPTHVLGPIRSLNERAKQKRREENIDIEFHSAGFRQHVAIDLLIDRP